MKQTTLFLCGDVMTGRGVDQILAHPGAPQLFERFVKSAHDYVALAEQKSGKIAAPVDDTYIWGDALTVLADVRPQVRVINLETAVTTSEAAWPGKAVHYRMHPANIGALTAFEPDCCVLANNHVLDWGRPGLTETLDTLRAAGLRYAGAGRDWAEATTPAAIELAEGGRILVFAWAVPSSGVPAEWAATDRSPGVAWLPDLSANAVAVVLEAMECHCRAGDLVVLSVHWGPNWGYSVAEEEQRFARALVDAGVDVVHGHSSHHPKGMEVYRGRLILYGCGDFLNDYEGIASYGNYRSDLTLMYFPSLSASDGRLLALNLVPTRIRQLSAQLADDEESRWLQTMLDGEGRRFGTRVERHVDRFVVAWDQS